MNQGFIRVAAASPAVTVANVDANVANIKELISKAYAEGVEVIVFPELCVTAYTCGDLFHSRTLIDAANAGVEEIRSHSESAPGILIVTGAPVEEDNCLYNCALAICNGEIVAAVPKTYIPNYNEFYEKRWFASAPEGYSTLIRHKGVTIGIEICEDLWTAIPPSDKLSLAGAEVILNLSASDDLIGKYHYLKNLVSQQSARCIGAYVYTSAGFGESSTDLVFDAKHLIAENGRMIAVNKRWQSGNQLTICDVDIEVLRRDRLHNTSFNSCARRNNIEYHIIDTESSDPRPANSNLLRDIDPRPFVPAVDSHLKERCEEIVNIQVAGLAQRLKATGCKKLVVGISGGLDSTLALLVATRTFDRLGMDRKGIIGVTMPGFGTTRRTHSNALTLMRELGVSIREISIAAAVNQHFKDIEHNPEVHDVTYENSQARERTQLLMDIANQEWGMVLGTGDLSELALGWATYNGDHMSMYGVNAGVPKTLVKHLTRYFADNTANEQEKEALLDIIDTPISPELIPAAADGTIKQKTEDLVGPYELHDFFLYYTLRYGFSPKKIYFLACKAFEGEFGKDIILKWERVFFRRFFNQQFKRSCLPDGPKVGSVCLSPRGDWRMPSDASSALWLKELEEL